MVRGMSRSCAVAAINSFSPYTQCRHLSRPGLVVPLRLHRFRSYLSVYVCSSGCVARRCTVSHRHAMVSMHTVLTTGQWPLAKGRTRLNKSVFVVKAITAYQLIDVYE